MATNPDESTIGHPPASSQNLELSASRLFMSWLAEQQVSLAFTTYQAGKLFLLGRKPDGRLSGFERTFERTMGLWSDGQTLWLSSVFQLWRMENMLPSGETTPDGYDRLYVPQIGYTTGDIDIHDVAVDADGRVVFVNTLFGCLATVSPRYSFEPIWKPPFISRLAAEDRCHLNGLAMQDGRPKYATACGRTGAPLLPVYTRRVESNTFDVVIGPPISMPEQVSRQDAVAQMVREYSSLLEAQVLNDPAVLTIWRHYTR